VEVNLMRRQLRLLHAGRQDRLLHRHSGKKLQLTDDETAMIMGHEMARCWCPRVTGSNYDEHRLVHCTTQLFGAGQLGDVAANLGAQLLTLKFSREDEMPFGLVGLGRHSGPCSPQMA
jgi:hypothetical protein